MKPCVAVLVLVAVSSLTSDLAQAQLFGRPGRPGRNPPGTWRYNRPLPGPSPLYPSYSSSNYYSYPNYYYPTPSYGTQSYSTYPSPTYSTPAIDYSASTPSVSAAPPVAANTVPVPRSIPAADGGTFTLTNPASNGGSIRYALNNFTYTMNPGESQTVPLDRDWVITFDSGFNQTIRYRMEPGQYEFTVSPQTGWNVMRHVRAAPPAPSQISPSQISPSEISPSEISPSDLNPALVNPAFVSPAP